MPLNGARCGSKRYARYPTAFASAYEEALEQDLSVRIPPPDGPSVLFGAFVGGALSGSAGLHVWPGMKQRHKSELWGMYVVPSLHGAASAPRCCAP